MDYIIQEYDEKYGWCLFRVCYGDKQFAEKRLEELKHEYPNLQLKLAVVEDGWWNDKFLSN